MCGGYHADVLILAIMLNLANHQTFVIFALFHLQQHLLMSIFFFRKSSAMCTSSAVNDDAVKPCSVLYLRLRTLSGSNAQQIRCTAQRGRSYRGEPEFPHTRKLRFDLVQNQFAPSDFTCWEHMKFSPLDSDAELLYWSHSVVWVAQRDTPLYVL